MQVKTSDDSIGIGDVRICYGEPPRGNPWRAYGLIGNERREAFRKFKAGEDVGDLAFWAVTRHDGAWKLTSSKQIIG